MPSRTPQARGGKPRSGDSVRSGAGRSDAPPRLDATNLAGITELMNRQNLCVHGKELEAVEQRVMGRTPATAAQRSAKRAEIDPVSRYTKELNDLAEELGVDFLGGGDKADSDDDTVLAARAPALAPARPRNPLGASAIDQLIGELDLGSESTRSRGSSGSSDSGDSDSRSDSGSSDSGSSYSRSGGRSVAASSAGSSRCSGSSRSRGSSSHSSALLRAGRTAGVDLDAARRAAKRRHRLHDVPAAHVSDRAHRSDLTEEQESRRHINSVIGDMRRETRTTFGIEHERAQDLKASKLEQIGMLRQSLIEEKVNCDGVGSPTMASPIEEIDSVLAILKLKNDRTRYASLAEEIIIGAAEGLETVFDGTREVPVVGWKPDYTGYKSTVRVKLSRMRFETSQVVGGAIEKYNFGPTSRILMELLPSFLLHPYHRRRQRSAPGLYNDLGGRPGGLRADDVNRSISALRRSDAPDDLSSIANI
jgi:hypothetical protein